MLAPHPYRIRLAVADEIAAWRAHLVEHIEENGRDGRYFAPYGSADGRARFTSPERLAESATAAGRRLDEPGWLRIFLGFDGGGAIAGHADVKGGELATERHRCRVGIGLLAAHQGKKLGESLMRAAIDWARAAGLRWMDLAVFAGNEPALALYRKLGFVEVGRVADRFRIDGAIVDDIAMALDLSSHPPAPPP